MSSEISQKSGVDYPSWQRRLNEAEDTLSAIRAGEVDAVVVDGPDGHRIYTLESPDQPFRIFVEQMQEGALTLNGEGTVIYCNRFFADLVGEAVEHVRGKPITHFIELSQDNDLLKLYAAAAEGFVHSEGWLNIENSSIPVQIALNPLPSTDLQMFGMVVTDLTERERSKKLEAERRAAEEANAARDQFLAVVSHELRTPLNAMLGWTQLLRYQTADPEAIKRGLDVIERNAWTQLQLIDDLLDISRVLAGKLRLELEPVDLVQATEASINSVLPSAAAKSIHIDTQFPSGKSLVLGDGARIQQIVTNLLSNAVKFTPENGRVTVSVTLSDGEVELCVRDSGIGIPAEFLPKLFGLYQQIEGSTTRRKGGLGLGLAIVKELTEMHRGRISADSLGDGQGATFTLQLPLLPPSFNDRTTSQAPRSVAENALDGIRVLLVEDDAATREMLQQILVHREARVTSVSNAQAALQALQNDRFDVLVSDIGLADMDGFELISKIRSTGMSGRQLPAVALTAFASREDRRQSLLAGFQVHLPKPVDQAELCAVIANLSGGLPQ